MRLLQEKKQWTRLIKNLDAKDLEAKDEEKRRKLFELMTPGNERKFFMKLQKWKRKKNEFPTELVVDGEEFYGADVLKGFSKAAFQQSRNPELEKRKIEDHYQNMKTVVKLAEIEAKSSHIQIKPLSKKEFIKVLKKLPRRKAQDVC